MKILVFSDSHGNFENMVQAVERETPHMILHLGDGWRDARRLQERFPDIPLSQVPGNCDFRSSEPPEQQLTVQGKRILLCHGHTYGVKNSLLTAGLAAEERDLDLFLFGHTHVPHPCAAGGQAGQDIVPESRQHRGLPSLLWRCDH